MPLTRAGPDLKWNLYLKASSKYDDENSNTFHAGLNRAFSTLLPAAPERVQRDVGGIRDVSSMY